jgi:hypothetical protein
MISMVGGEVGYCGPDGPERDFAGPGREAESGPSTRTFMQRLPSKSALSVSD